MDQQNVKAQVPGIIFWHSRQKKKMRVNNGKLNIRSETLRARLDYVNVLKTVLKLGLF